MFSVEGKDQELLKKIYDLEIKRAELLTKMNSLNSIRNSVSRSLEDLINVNSAGIEDGGFMATISELKALYLKRLEMSTIYTPDSEPMREINKLINEARGKSYGRLNDYSSVYNEQLAKINDDIRRAELDLVHLPDDQRKYIDMEREYKVIETTYNTLLSKQAETQLRLATAKSDLTIIDPAKDLGQGPIGPNVALVKYGLVFGFMLIPLLLILVTEILDNRVKSIAELLGVIKIPLLGVIGKNLHENNLTVLEQPKSSISEAFRGIRANLRFLYNEDGNILATFRIPTHLEFTEDTLFIMLNEFAKSKNLEISNMKNIIVSSVVPNINENFTRLGKKYFEIDPTFVTLDNVENKIKEIKILPNMERGLGADRIVDILAAKKLYPEKELLIIDFGTATTFDMIKDSTYMGGCIIPGIALSINALFSNTAALPKIEFTEPETVLGINTVSQINAGIFYGNVGSIKELILQYKKFFPNAYVIATGGQGEKISEYIEQIDEYVPKLGEIGIFEFYRLNFLKENSDGI